MQKSKSGCIGFSHNRRDSMSNLEYGDTQGIIFRGYNTLPAACFVLLQISEGRTRDAKSWLKTLVDENEITNAETKERRKDAIQVAFTVQGMRTLGLDGRTHFSCEFEDGMATRHKQRILGDHGESSPCNWVWGGTQDNAETIHILLMLYAAVEREGDTSQLDQLYASHQQRFEESGLAKVIRLSTRTLTQRKEHFGFADGIAQPILAGTPRAQATPNKGNVLPPGEFILGFKNLYDRYPESPAVPASLDPRNLLPELKSGEHDLGRNGSYMVFRQLKQDVKAFWEFLDAKTTRDGRSDPEARDWMAAKLVGRWRSGVSLMHSPDRDDPNLDPGDNFSYVDSEGSDSDPLGFKCPLGSHIRRTNPRDSVFPGTDNLLSDSNKHRILRRGRAYGPAVAPSMEPEDILEAQDNGQERGLHFICFNSDIARQFEFVQHTWINNPKFASMYSETDPLVGAHTHNMSNFTIPAHPVRKRLTGLDRFVSVRGGAYFFLPGIRAIRVLAELP